MTDHAQYTADEQQRIRASIIAGDAPACPLCDVTLTTRPLGGGAFGLGYARRPEWLTCPQRNQPALFDLKHGPNT